MNVMYKCRDCGAVFKEPHVRRYESSEYGATVDILCPDCSGEYLVEVHTCNVCGEHTEEELWCSTCRIKARAALNEFAMKFSPEMLELLDAILEGDSLMSMREVDHVCS